MLQNDREKLIKKLVYQSNYMGCKENDIVFGRFATDNLKYMQEKELALYQSLLQHNDADLFSWITKQNQYPEKFQALIDKIASYQPPIKNK
jgi:antitoxin CptB